MRKTGWHPFCLTNQFLGLQLLIALGLMSILFLMHPIPHDSVSFGFLLGAGVIFYGAFLVSLIGQLYRQKKQFFWPVLLLLLLSYLLLFFHVIGRF